MTKSLTTMGIFVLVLVWLMPVSANQLMTAQELKQVFSNSTQTGIARSTSKGPQKYWLYKRADGTMTYMLEGGWKDEGSWWITDDGRSCTKLKKVRKGKARCSKIYRDDNQYKVIRPDGSETEFLVEPGNTQGL